MGDRPRPPLGFRIVGEPLRNVGVSLPDSVRVGIAPHENLVILEMVDEDGGEGIKYGIHAATVPGLAASLIGALDMLDDLARPS